MLLLTLNFRGGRLTDRRRQADGIFQRTREGTPGTHPPEPCLYFFFFLTLWLLIFVPLGPSSDAFGMNFFFTFYLVHPLVRSKFIELRRGKKKVKR
ncbi:uncharacterized protein BO80DRAFT_137775 [Aspergillus ibericus CBS 121593]|uniref:Uncharacterized protein n=1 Tax=Aspergillus ibericus CBS 121593 TaxID=1448316 RepID=A0A395HDB0_9EURO|nr:hypothetical protein BO80DRAFT_137775 [Aspergillus ibericus CBS 121593]RAL05489.1 hypothetical protein BO80DRAFT_137775 [Aspergillus ibericus CBS 121593]